jgi:hypothetical protein
VPLIEHKTLEVEFLACVVDVYADEVAFSSIVENHSSGDFSAISARSVSKVNIKRISSRTAAQSHI